MEKSVQEFHKICRHSWNSINCPVCFYINNPNTLKGLTCMKCCTKKSLFICVICAHVGCGNDAKSHALAHFHTTGHFYSMAVKTLETWDLRINKLVHRMGENIRASDSFCSYGQDNSKNHCMCVMCVYKKSPRLQKKFGCMMCEENHLQNLWICLSCSHIGCSENKSQHSKIHSASTTHPRAMHLGSYNVYDYKERRYVKIQVHHAKVSAPPETAQVCSLQVSDGCCVPTTSDYVSQNEQNYNRPRMSSNTATVVKNGNGYFTQKPPSPAEILLQHHHDFAKRIEYLESQWQHFSKLTDTGKIFATIEKRLLNVINERKPLEGKLHEHDTKINDLLTQFAARDSGNSSPTSDVHSDEVETVTTVALSPVCVNAPESCEIDWSSCQTQFLYLMILGLVVHYILSLILKTACEDFKNLFNY